MNCPKCGNVNEQTSKFCIRCGNVLNNIINQNAQPNLVNNQAIDSNVINQNAQPNLVNNQINQNGNVQQPKLNNHVAFNYFIYIIAVFLKPFKCFKEEENKLCEPKISIVMGVIISGLMMIINLISSMFSCIFEKKYNFFGGGYTTEIDFSNLEDLNYLSLIFKNLFVYAFVIALIALIYYLGTLIIKKKTNYIKILSMVITAIIPYVAFGMLVTSIFSKIWAPLGFLTMLLGIIYSLLIFVTLIDEELKFEKKDEKIYFNTICITVLGFLSYIILTKIVGLNFINF